MQQWGDMGQFLLDFEALVSRHFLRMQAWALQRLRARVLALRFADKGLIRVGPANSRNNVAAGGADARQNAPPLSPHFLTSGEFTALRCAEWAMTGQAAQSDGFRFASCRIAGNG